MSPTCPEEAFTVSEFQRLVSELSSRTEQELTENFSAIAVIRQVGRLGQPFIVYRPLGDEPY